MLKIFDILSRADLRSMLNILNMESGMSFTEKSAWVMSIALSVGGIAYFGIVLLASRGQETLVSPTLPLVAMYTAALVCMAIVGHIVAASSAPHEASAVADERERMVANRASRLASRVLAAGTVLSLVHYLLFADGDLLFYALFASLMLGQLADYVGQIVFFRVRL